MHSKLLFDSIEIYALIYDIVTKLKYTVYTHCILKRNLCNKSMTTTFFSSHITIVLKSLYILILETLKNIDISDNLKCAYQY